LIYFLATIMPPFEQANRFVGEQLLQNAPLRRSQRRQDWQDPMYGALDLGTNNCRLLIARPVAQGFRVVDAFSKVVRLGEGLHSSGVLSEAAQQRAIEALLVCADKLERRHVRMTRNVATEACRRARNCQSFVERVYAQTGLHLDVISPAEEARLAVLGCQALLDPEAHYALVFDIGGGSTEITLVSQGASGILIEAWMSMPWGVISLFEAYGCSTDHARTYAQMCQAVGEHIACFAQNPVVAQLMHHPHLQVIGTSGTVTTLASLHLQLPNYDRRLVDGCDIPADALRMLSSELAALSPDERALRGGIGRERSELVLPGCAILQTILECWPIKTLRVADRGIREGVLRLLLSYDGYRQ
jgi:exopolyphosphatase / guanosine-5'-triphosphate,3'-diphosphate pyrophosphatase